MMSITNRLFNAAKPDADLKALGEALVKMVANHFDKPVRTGIVIALEDGDPFDFTLLGDMTPRHIAWAGNAIEVATAAGAANRGLPAANEVDTEGPPDGIDDETWASIPPAMRQELRDAAAEGRLHIERVGDAPDAEPKPVDLDEVLAKGLDEDY